jgi:hypothetical protein
VLLVRYCYAPDAELAEKVKVEAEVEVEEEGNKSDEEIN